MSLHSFKLGVGIASTGCAVVALLLALSVGGCARQGSPAGVGASGHEGATLRVALVAKSLGNGFFNAVDKGGEEAARELGRVQVIDTGPTSTTAEGQIDVLNALDRTACGCHRGFCQRSGRAGADAQEGARPRH